MHHTTDHDCGRLESPTRNHYFYGKLLTVDDLNREQDYFAGMQRLLNRLTLGSGVVCGLGVSSDGKDITVEAGVAIDECGCVIVVPAAKTVNLDALIAAHPEATTETDDGSLVTELCLAYRECLVDPVPVTVPECDKLGDCAANTVEEGFEIVIRPVSGEEPDEEAKASACELDLFPQPDDDTLSEQLCTRIGEPCPDPASDACVPLARVRLNGEGEDGVQVEECAHRPLIYGNPLLYELIVCLMQSLEELSSTPVLSADSSDVHVVGPDDGRVEGLVVEVHDLRGNPLSEVIVHLEATDGGELSLAPDDDPNATHTLDVEATDGETAPVNWQLAEEPEHQVLVASADGAPGRIVFHATVAPRRRGLLGRRRRDDDE